MILRKSATVLLAVVAILLIFFFPAHIGPFSVTHGPATAFRALRAARRIIASMATACLIGRLALGAWIVQATTVLAPRKSEPALLSLRC